MYIHFSWYTKQYAGQVHYAPNAIKNLILIEFDASMVRKASSILLVYENNEWIDYSHPVSFGRPFIDELLAKLSNVTTRVKAEAGE